MLSINKVSLRNAEYYANLAREDYYLQGGEPPGQWHGRGAAALGLTGQVAREQFLNLFQGFAPDGSEPLVQNAGQQSGYHRRCPAWDLTFSAPKSVSVLWALAPSHVREAIEEAQTEAVRAALDLMEDFAAVTRRGSGGKTLEKASFCYAFFDHGTSRNQDPQLHTHAICFNLTVRQDGTTGAVRSNSLFDLKMAVGALYRCQLASALQRKLGLRVEKVKSWFEIQGVDPDLAERFSSRRKQILDYCQQHGVEGAIEAEKATLATREVKGHVARGILFQQWQQIGKEYGWGREQVLGLVRPNEYRPEMTSQSQPTDRKVKEMDSAPVKSRAWIRTLEEAAVAAQTNGLSAHEVVAGLHVPNERTLKPSTAAQDALSTPVREPAPDTTNTQSMGPATPPQASSQIDSRPQQPQSPNRASATARTKLLLDPFDLPDNQMTQPVYQSRRGLRTRSPLVVMKIRDEVPRLGKPIRSLDLRFFSLEIRPERVFPNVPWWNPLQRVLKTSLVSRVASDPFGWKRRITIPLEQNRRAAARQIKKIILSVLAAGARAILLNDERFDSLVHAVGWVRTEIRRATRPRIVIAKTSSQTWRTLLRDWCETGISRPEDVVMVTGTGIAAERLNRAAQEIRRRSGQIGLERVAVGPRTRRKEDRLTLSLNDRVIFKTGFRGLVEPHEAGTVTRISDEQIRFSLDSGKSLDLTVEKCRSAVQLGYAVRHEDADRLKPKRALVLFEANYPEREMASILDLRGQMRMRIYSESENAEFVSPDGIARLRHRIAAQRMIARDAEAQRQEHRQRELERRQAEELRRREEEAWRLSHQQNAAQTHPMLRRMR